MCPCVKHRNLENLNVSKIKEYLYFDGICESYKQWIWHGENVQSTKYASKNNVGKDYGLDFDINLLDMIDDAQYETTLDPIKFKFLLSDVEKPIYPSCTKVTKLFVVFKL